MGCLSQGARERCPRSSSPSAVPGAQQPRDAPHDRSSLPPCSRAPWRRPQLPHGQAVLYWGAVKREWAHPIRSSFLFFPLLTSMTLTLGRGGSGRETGRRRASVLFHVRIHPRPD